jgi:hypothetical protein
VNETIALRAVGSSCRGNLSSDPPELPIFAGDSSYSALAALHFPALTEMSAQDVASVCRKPF